MDKYEVRTTDFLSRPPLNAGTYGIGDRMPGCYIQYENVCAALPSTAQYLIVFKNLTKKKPLTKAQL